mmetsp:Transcript_3814/g.10007  ORF Transcript_3814/g.10007 Transcript_3814/m.10007 type:complete len:346 (-) Transcript_3814:287-1324(-)|eukprot:CAMPEP_0197173024 /NCGR_PEP_ID=MMETSP1423-20130617/91_1 /TAXON_ID=476441 /ORGANISM="Pseudo-nitzschia heimii, Strain UNC1101" /LENGTH=345 /DNA_ID=CAMNT_0042621767 /DNA_START=25 /DNA_END=1062 /DNA_ORIENTATION=-
MRNSNDESGIDWEKSINSIMEASDDVEARKVKKLRKMVLLSLQMDESDKAAKKLFKKVIQDMEKNGKVKLDANGTISLLGSKKKKKRRGTTDEDKRKSKKKRSEKKPEKTDDDTSKSEDDKSDDGGKELQNEEVVNDSTDKNAPCKGNPQGVTRLFLGNLPFSVDESSLSAFLPGIVTHIKWITDKETGKFYGSAFIEMDNSTSAAEAVAMAGSKLIGRPIKINLAPAREGDTWPPVKKVMSGGRSSGGGQAGGSGVKAMSAKPDNCLKLFIGNLSYDIDDEGIIKFFANVDAEVKAVRWLHHKDSGDFKGCGFVEFWNAEACEKGATLNGKNLLGRPIRIDWTD